MTTESFLVAFSQAIVRRDFGRAEGMLASWTRAALPDGGLKRVVHLARGNNPPAVVFEIAPLAYDNPTAMRESVEEHAGDEDYRTLAETDGTGGLYGSPSFPIPDELTDANFSGCWRLEFLPDEELELDVDYSFAFYVAVALEHDELKIGYIEPMD